MLTTDWLSHHPEHCATLAGWLYRQFPYESASSRWLACVYVHPEARGRGLAGRLIEEVCAEARALGHTRLYLHTQDRADYYARRGWTVLETFEAWGMTHQLMVRPL